MTDTADVPGRAASTPQSPPFVVIVPDTFGSHLRDANGRVWLDVPALANEGLQRLASMTPGAFVLDGVSAALYGPLVEALEQASNLPTALATAASGGARCEVDAFDYDWRASALDSSETLAPYVREQLERRAGEMHFLAHGAGGLVVLAMLARHPEIATALRDRGTRIALVGTPVQGTWDVARMLAGEHPVSQLLTRLSANSSNAVQVGRTFAAWPGLVEQLPRVRPLHAARESGALPEDTAIIDPALAPFGVADAISADIETRVRELVTALEQVSASAQSGGMPKLFALIGFGVPTPATASRAQGDGDGTTFLYSASGDGRVLAANARFPGAQHLALEASHAEFISSTELAKGYLELLLTGASTIFRVLGDVAQDEAGAARVEAVPDGTPTSVELAEAAIGARARGTAIVLPLRVGVMHGHLREAEFPLMVGHYDGDALLSAEEALDQALGGSLRRRFDLATYPGPRGTVTIVRRRGRHPPGAIVIGLGPVGEFNAPALEQLVTDAAVRYAAEIADEVDAGAPWRSAAFSTLLLGTGGGASVSIADCVRAITRAALVANRQLRQTGQWQRVRIDHIQFVELFEDLAAHAARSVVKLPETLAKDLAANEEIRPDRRLLVRRGGEFQRPFEARQSGWSRRIQVKANRHAQRQEGASDDALVLSFSAVGDMARVESESAVQNQEQVLRLVNAAMTDPKLDLKLSNTLYELLVPAGIKSRIPESENVLLQLDPEAARYPFEIMATRSRDVLVPLVQDRVLLRQLETGEADRAHRNLATGRNMLIVGAPRNVTPILVGARAEAFQVESLARELGWAPTRLTDATGRSILTELFARDYRILHFAAHGQYDDEPLKSGIVIDRDDYITAAHVASLPALPEFVFLNCCHSGQLGQAKARAPNADFPRLAASIAEGFIRAGARAVIAAGWTVDDDAALAFATEFYGRFLSGETFGTAVREARRKVYATHGTTSTWGAYQCYGDAQYRLRVPRPGSGEAKKSSIVCRSEFIASIRTLVARAGGARGELLQKLSSEFDAMREQAPDEWKDGEVLAELGWLAAELGRMEDAGKLYDEALRAAKALMPLKAVEQLANVLSRSVPTATLVKGLPAEQANPLFQKASDWLDWLESKLPKSAERSALRGALYKRWSLVATNERERKQRLVRSRDAYSEARGLAAGKQSYQFLNWVALRYLLEGPRARKELVKLVQDELARARSNDGQSQEPDFWTRVAVPDAMLHAALVDNSITSPDAIRRIEQAYDDALATGPSARELASVRDHIEFLAATVPVCFGAGGTNTAAALQRIALRLA